MKFNAAALIFLACTSLALADPAVLFDGAQTRPMTDYLPVPQTPAPIAPRLPQNAIPPSPAYPVRTPGLTAGEFAPIAAQLPQLADRPFFLVGSDAFSRNWLLQHRSRLAALNASGILVQAENADEYNSIKAIAGNLLITPLDARELAKTLGLSHYPALVSSTRIEQ